MTEKAKQAVVVDLFGGQGTPALDRVREYKDLGELYVAGFTHALEADEDLLVLTHEPEPSVEGLHYKDLYVELLRQGFSLYNLENGQPVPLDLSIVNA